MVKIISDEVVDASEFVKCSEEIEGRNVGGDVVFCGVMDDLQWN